MITAAAAMINADELPVQQVIQLENRSNKLLLLLVLVACFFIVVLINNKENIGLLDC